jgi:ABC-2 type transport system ATP-binding protein
MLLGMISPTSGESFIFGKQVHQGNHDIWEKVGYLVEVPYSYPDLTVRENIEIFRRLRFLPDKMAVDQIIDKLQLGQYADRKAKNLSQGNSQRLGLAKALIHNPQILILDEPSNSLDPAGIVEIRELLLDVVANHGVTVFISSHILGEISKIATRIGIIHQGRLIQEVDTDQLVQFRKKSLYLNTYNNDVAVSILAQKGYSFYIAEEGVLETTDNQAIHHPDDIASILVNAGIPPVLLRVGEEDLEQYFLRTIGSNGGIE